MRHHVQDLHFSVMDGHRNTQSHIHISHFMLADQITINEILNLTEIKTNYIYVMKITKWQTRRGNIFTNPDLFTLLARVGKTVPYYFQANHGIKKKFRFILKYKNEGCLGDSVR